MNWVAKNLSQNEARVPLISRVTESHPLSVVRAVEVKELANKNKQQIDVKQPVKKDSWIGLDPLSAALSQTKIEGDSEDDDVLTDPLNQQFSKTSVKQTSRSSSLSSHSSSLPVLKENDDQSWNAFRQEILFSHTTTNKLSFKSSFLSGGILVKQPVLAQSLSVTDKVKNRLEQLDEMVEDVREEHDLSQKEYVNRIEELNRQLISAWSSDQRVKALKITIQSAKILADASSTLDFYPFKFALVSDILDTFGNLVYSRIREKSMTTTDEQAIETCRNWFFKIASIRELIPRFYLECCIMRTYSFLRESENSTSCPGSVYSSILRLSRMIRGMSNPLVAAYARVYLIRIAVKIIHLDKSFLRSHIDEVFVMTDQFPTHVVQDALDSHRFSLEGYCQLYSPCLQWFCKCIGQDVVDHSLEQPFQEILTLIGNSQVPEMNLVLLNAVATSFKASFVVKLFERIWESFTDHCQVNDTTAFTPLFVSLGKAFSVKSQTPKDLHVLQRVWEKVSHLPLLQYLSCAESWLTFVVSNFTHKEINSFLRDVVKHLGEKNEKGIRFGQNEELAVSLKQIDKHLEKMMNIVFQEYSKNYCHLMSMETIVHVMQSFNEDSTRISVSKFIVTSFTKKMNRAVEEYGIQEENIDVLNNLNFLCQIMHDCVSAISLEDEKRDISLLITAYLRLVLFCPGLDIETRFKLLQEARASFFNIDQVLSFLIFAVNSLPMTDDGRKMPSDFVRTCLAYSFTTIPSIEDPVLKLQLYLNSCEVSLSNACLSQLETFIKTMVNLLSQLPRNQETHDGQTVSLETVFLSTCCSLLTLLLVTPDHPDHEPLYLVKGLINMIETHDSQSGDIKASLYLKVLTFLSWCSQETYPVIIEGVDSNDTLYGSDPEFLDDISNLTTKVLKLYLDHLSSLSGDEKLEKKQAEMCLQLFHVIVLYAELKFMGKLVVKLWQIMLKYSSVDKQFRNKMMKSLFGIPEDMRVAIEGIQVKGQGRQ